MLTEKPLRKEHERFYINGIGAAIAGASSHFLGAPALAVSIALLVSTTASHILKQVKLSHVMYEKCLGWNTSSALLGKAIYVLRDPSAAACALAVLGLPCSVYNILLILGGMFLASHLALPVYEAKEILLN